MTDRKEAEFLFCHVSCWFPFTVLCVSGFLFFCFFFFLSRTGATFWPRATWNCLDGAVTAILPNVTILKWAWTQRTWWELAGRGEHSSTCGTVSAQRSWINDLCFDVTWSLSLHWRTACLDHRLRSIPSWEKSSDTHARVNLTLPAPIPKSKTLVCANVKG